MEVNPVSLNGIKTYPFKNHNQLLSFIDGREGMLIAVNAEKILYATEKSRSIINKNIGYPDGIGAVWALRQKGKPANRIPGVELWLEIVKKFYKSRSFYIIGGKQDIIQSTIEKLNTEFPGINILKYRDGYIKTDNEKEALIRDVKKEKPDIVFVAMGSPKQEFLMREMQQVHPAIYQGLGGSFDVYTGSVKRAPKFWANNGLEWFYRWMSDPFLRSKRILNLTKFYWKLKTNQF